VGIAPTQLPGLVYQRRWSALGYLALVVVGVLSLIPAPVDIHGSDKLLHFLTYAALGAGFTLIACSLRQTLISAGLLIAYGIVLEVLQGMTGYRMFELLDMLANSSGVLVSLLLWLTPLPQYLRTVEKRVARP
jgi:VanZ family protein